MASKKLVPPKNLHIDFKPSPISMNSGNYSSLNARYVEVKSNRS